MRIVEFFDGAQSETTPTIGNIVASGIITYPDDTTYEASEQGAPQRGNIYYNTTIEQLRYYNGTEWITIIDATTAQTLTNKTIDADANTITNIDDDEIKTLAGINAEKIADGSVSNLEYQRLDGVTSPIQTQLDAKQETSEKGQPNGYAGLDGSGLVPAAQLPSFVDDVEEYADFASFPVMGETGKIYVALDTNRIYRWSGSMYIEIAPGSSATGGTNLIGGGTKTFTPANPTFNTVSFNNVLGANNGATVPYNPTFFAQSTNISASTWFKTADANASFGVMFSHAGNGNTDSAKWYIYMLNGIVGFVVSADGSTGSPTQVKNYQTTVTYNDNAWHHAAFTFTGNTLRVYIDGVELTGGTLNQALNGTVNSLFANTGDVVLGAFENNSFSEPKLPFVGNVDELNYWDKELTPAEITELYNAGEAFNLTGHSAAGNLLCWWRGDGDVAPTVIDQINAQNATITGSFTLDNTDAAPGSATPAQFTFTQDLQLLIPGLAYADNVIPVSESPILFPNDGDVAYVQPNEAPGGGNLSVTVDAPENIPDNGAAILWLEGNTLTLGNTHEEFPGPTVGANVSLSNLQAPVAFNQNLLPDATDTREIGDASNRIFSINSKQYTGEEVILSKSTNQKGVLGPRLFSNPATVVDQSITIETKERNINDANPSGDVYVLSGNNTNGTGDSGDIIVSPGTSVGGNRGQITFQDGTEGTAGHVWTSTDSTGKGQWLPAGGASKVRVSAKRTGSAINVNSGADTSIIFDNEDYDLGGDYNNANGIFTAPRNGYYQISASLLYSSYAVNSTIDIQIRVNAVEVLRNIIYPNSVVSGQWNPTINATVFMTSGSILRIWTSQNSGATRQVINSILDTYLMIDEL